MQFNRFGYVTDISINNNTIDAVTFDGARTFIPTYQEIRFSGVAVGNQHTLKLLERLMHEGLTYPVYEPEFMCLFCGSPQPISRTHCKQCGAPRSFIIG